MCHVSRSASLALSNAKYLTLQNASRCIPGIASQHGCGYTSSPWHPGAGNGCLLGLAGGHRQVIAFCTHHATAMKTLGQSIAKEKAQCETKAPFIPSDYSCSCINSFRSMRVCPLWPIFSCRTCHLRARCLMDPEKKSISLACWLPTMLAVAKLAGSKGLAPWVIFCAVACIGVGIGAGADAGREALAEVRPFNRFSQMFPWRVRDRALPALLNSLVFLRGRECGELSEALSTYTWYVEKGTRWNVLLFFFGVGAEDLS